MARNKKRNDGYYQKNFRYEGKQYTVYGASQKEAEEKKIAKLKALQEGTEEHENPTLNKYYEMFTEFRRNKVVEATLRCQVHSFRQLASTEIVNGETLGEMKLSDIKPNDIKKVQKELEKTNLSVRSINDYMAHLKHVFKKAVDDEYILKNPCSAIEKLKDTKTPASETKHRALSKGETEKFFAASKESFYNNFFKLLIQTGMRIGEATALTYSDIDMKNNCIHVTKTITRDEIGDYLVGDTTKTKAGARNIDLNDTIIGIINEQKKQNILFNGNTISFDNLLFKSSVGQILREYTVNREIKRICKKAGIDYFTCHAFRSTFATRFIEQRPQDYKALSKILGHSDIKITLNLYTHVMDETKANAMKNIHIAM